MPSRYKSLNGAVDQKHPQWNIDDGTVSWKDRAEDHAESRPAGCGDESDHGEDDRVKSQGREILMKRDNEIEIQELQQRPRLKSIERALNFGLLGLFGQGDVHT